MKFHSEIDWLRNFGFFLWYNDCSSEGAFRHLFEDFRKELSQNRSIRKPIPMYLEQRRALSSSSSSADASANLIKTASEFESSAFHILEIYSGDRQFFKLFEPKSAVPHPLDHSFGWMVHSLLASKFSVINGNPHKISALAVNFAEQLEVLGLWEWAIYVLMTIPNFEQSKEVEELKS